MLKRFLVYENRIWDKSPEVSILYKVIREDDAVLIFRIDGTVEFSSEISISLNFTVEHAEASGNSTRIKPS